MDGLLQYYQFNVHALDTETTENEIMGSTGQKVTAQQAGADSLEYFIFNGHGDITGVTDASGNLIKSYDYDAWGVEKNPDPNDTNPWRYCGEMYDSDTGTYYLRARVYNPKLGRFTSEDTVRQITRELPNGQKVIDPLGLNLYTYCYNNPIMFVDPTGNSGTWVDLGKGWKVRIEPSHVDNGKGDHIHIEYKGGKKIFSQNDDGTPHDKNNNSPGSPSDKVLAALKEKTGWDWNSNIEKFANEVDLNVFAVQGGFTTYVTITYPDGSQATIMDSDAMIQGGTTPQEIWEAYRNATPPANQPQFAQPGNTGPYFLPVPGPSIPFGPQLPAPTPFPAFPHVFGW